MLMIYDYIEINKRIGLYPRVYFEINWTILVLVKMDVNAASDLVNVFLGQIGHSTEENCLK